VHALDAPILKASSPSSIALLIHSNWVGSKKEGSIPRRRMKSYFSSISSYVLGK
jgi:hypothetical protein